MQVNRYRSGTIRFVPGLSRELNEIVKRLCSNVFYGKLLPNRLQRLRKHPIGLSMKRVASKGVYFTLGTRTEQRKGKVGRRNGKLKGTSQSTTKMKEEDGGIFGNGMEEILYIYMCNVFFFFRLRRFSYLLVWNRAPWRGIEDGKYKEYRKPLEPKGE